MLGKSVVASAFHQRPGCVRRLLAGTRARESNVQCLIGFRDAIAIGRARVAAALRDVGPLTIQKAAGNTWCRNRPCLIPPCRPSAREEASCRLWAIVQRPQRLANLIGVCAGDRCGLPFGALADIERPEHKYSPSVPAAEPCCGLPGPRSARWPPRAQLETEIDRVQRQLIRIVAFVRIRPGDEPCQFDLRSEA